MIRVADAWLHRAARAQAVGRGETLGSVVEGMLRGYVVDGRASQVSGRAAEVSKVIAETQAGLASATCLQCAHPFGQHRAQKGSKSLFCQVAGCACRVAG